MNAEVPVDKAEAQIEDLKLVSSDGMVSSFGITTDW